MLFLMGCSQTTATQGNDASEKKKDSMHLAYNTEYLAIPPIDAATPSHFETASFGLGWFWGIESRFGIIEGVIRTRVGYAGGKVNDPNYSKIGDHTETVQVDYDPERITYSQLLEIFWQRHRPDKQSWSRQYMNAVFYHNEQQHQLAMTSKAAVEQRIGRIVKTKVVPLRSFTKAEDYHQKYILKGHYELNKEMLRIYPRHQDFVDSTAVARLNAYAGGHGTRSQLLREIEMLGLSDEGRKILTELVGR